MLAVYWVLSAVLILVADRFFPVLRQSWSWWLTPLLLIGFFVCLVLLHALVFVCSIACISRKSDPNRGSGYLRFLIRITLPAFFRLARIHIHLSGLDKVPENGRMLFVCNHLDNVDPVVFYYAFPRAQLSFVAKKEIYIEKKYAFAAKAMHKLNCIPIDRQNDREAAKSIILASRLIKEDRNSVVIFPEGHCSEDGELQPFRNGAFKIAYKAKAPTVVCALSGTDRMIPNLFRRKTVLHFEVLEVIPPAYYEDHTTSQLGDRVHEEIRDAVARMRGGQ